METIVVRENLDLEVGHRVVARLRADEALNLAGQLARRAFRRIAVEEGINDEFFEEPKEVRS